MKEMGNKGIVICQPLAEERAQVKRVFINLADFIARNGYPVLLFDYFGEGDSEGAFDEADVETRISDILEAIDVLKLNTSVTEIGLLGFRLGATFAALAAEIYSKISFLFMVQPVVNGEAFMQNWLRVNLTSQITMYGEVKVNREQLIASLLSGISIEVQGYIINKRLYQQMSNINLINAKWFSPTTVIEIVSKNGLSDNDIKTLVNGPLKDRCHYCAINRSFEWQICRNYYPLSEELMQIALQRLNMESENGKDRIFY
jgi:esterase/lipase